MSCEYGIYAEQELRIPIPDALLTELIYSKDEIVHGVGRGYRGTAVDLKYQSGNPAGVLVYYPGISASSLLLGT